MHINGFRSAKILYYLIYNNKIRICIKGSSTVAEFRLFQLLLKKQMAPFYEKGGILHLSYLLNESGNPNFFLFLLYVYFCEI